MYNNNTKNKNNVKKKYFHVMKQLSNNARMAMYKAFKINILKKIIIQSVYISNDVDFGIC